MIKQRNRDSERMLALLEMLRNRFDHPSAQDCYLEMRKMIPGIGQSTVYRHLAKLAGSGLVEELRPKGGTVRFDAAMDAHAHFFCNKCRTLSDVPTIVFNVNWPGKANRVEVMAKGVCGKCLKKGEI